MTQMPDRSVALWLFACCFMVVVMVVVGGYTRLSESGLSIVEWAPATGVLYPMDEATWQQEFEKYKQSPEFQKKNYDMELLAFKQIYFVEYIHRLLGRIVGLVFFIPLVFFVLKRRVTGALTWKLLGIFVLGGLQGFIGWFMVRSGLIDNPWVSPVRLALHLGLAFILFVLLMWQGVKLWGIKQIQWKGELSDIIKLRNLSFGFTAVVFLQILAGALVAGLDAGLVYNTFPLMDGDFVPEGLYPQGFASIFQDHTTVQFHHRIMAYIVVLGFFLLWLQVHRYARKTRISFYINLLLVTIGVQVVVGIATLLMAVPMGLALLHQILALVLLAISVFINQQLCDVITHSRD